MAGAAGGADGADDGEDHVFAGDAQRQVAVDRDAHVLGPLLHQGLGRQHMLHFARADAESEAAESAMRCRMAVAAHQRDAGLGGALFRPDDMDDALALVHERNQRHVEIGAVLHQGFELHARLIVFDALAAIGGRNDMIRHGKHRVGPAHRAVVVAHAFETGPARDLVSQMHVDIQQRRAVIVFGDDMALPYLVEQGLSRAHLPFLLRRPGGVCRELLGSSVNRRLVFGFGAVRRRAGGAVIALLADARRFAAPAAQII